MPQAAPTATERSEVCHRYGACPLEPLPTCQDGRSGRVCHGAGSIDTSERSENAGLD